MDEEFFEIVSEHWGQILNLYKKIEDKKPIMLIDIQEQKLYAYPYLDYKSSLTERSQAMLEKEYEAALLNNKVVVFVQDNENKQLWSQNFDLE
ncbi:MAG: hypothetical protein K8R06_07295 [Methanosarcinales archaeon]|nr:hypothetical protein [Methanosarcinales archaeon]MCD4798642.1 hypothetical protein [Methanosarcinales archaeon]MCD4809695.1 hypothetical protein [Methanosarcinales archaeon]MCD4816190.1 hypothetical protein [Methanosarcinales archaeon]